MKTLSFVLWMLLWWPSIELCNYLSHLMGRSYSEDVISFAVGINFGIWVIVGIALYIKTKEDK